MSKQLNVLLVAPGAEQLSYYARLDQRYSLTSTECGCKALDIMSNGTRFDVLVTEADLPDMTGNELISKAGQSPDTTASVLIHSHLQACIDAEQTTKDDQLVEHLNKPVGEFTLFMAVDTLARRSQS